MNVLGVVSLVCAIMAFAGSWHYLNLKPWRLRLGAVLVFGILSLPSLLFAGYYLHILPEKAWFYTLRSWQGSELLAVFAGAAAAAFSTLLPRFLLIIPLLATIVTAAAPYLKMAMCPLDRTQLRDRWQDDACLQSTESTCGPASAASILRFLGYEASEGEIARAAFTTSRGTEAWYLARYFRARGLRARFDFRDTFDSSVGLPAVVGVRMASFGHFIAVLEAGDGMVTFVDPLSGQRTVTEKEFRHTHEFTGFHLSVTKPD